MARADIEEIRRQYPLDAVASRYGLKISKDGREWRSLCPFHAEDTASFSIFPGRDGSQRFICFGCGAHGDVIDFVCEWSSLDVRTQFREAVASLQGDPPPAPVIAASSRDPYAGLTFIPPPDDASPILVGRRSPPIWNPKRDRSAAYRPSAVYPYPGHGYVIRIEIDTAHKITPQILWSAEKGWCHGSMPSPRPLYRAAGLAERPIAPVLIVEGEKCVDASTTVLTRWAVVSWAGGGKAWQKTDWTPLSGRQVTIWPDNDPPGQATGRAVAGRLAELGASVSILDLPADRPKGWDIADAIGRDWWDVDEIEQFIARQARVFVGERGREVMQTDAVSPARTELDTKPRKEVMPSTGRSKHNIGDAPRPNAARSGEAQSFTGGENADRRGDQRSGKSDVGDKSASSKLDVGGSAPSVRSKNMDQSGDDSIMRGGDGQVDDPSEFIGWRSTLITNEDGKIKPRLATNWKRLLHCHEETRGLLAWNDITQGVFLMRRPPWDDKNKSFLPRAMIESDIFNAVTWLESHGCTPRRNDARDTIRVVAALKRFNPVQDYLDGLKWDGIPRLQGGMWEGDRVPPLNVEYFGSPDDPIFATFTRKWHVAAVARALRPGAKVDTMMILEGAQGRKKSTYFRVMSEIGGHEYFADSVGDITAPGSIMLLQGTWIVEVSDLAGFYGKDVLNIKAWMSRTTDRFVPKFESEPREIPRHFVVAGTHNPSGHGYLNDPTGGRRFWPVPTVEVDLDRVKQDRDQIWAEAVHLYRMGDEYWLSPDEAHEADKLTSDRRAEDPWGSRIDEYLGTNGVTVSISSILRELQIPTSQQSIMTVKRISEHLTMTGWERQKDNGRRVWRKGEQTVSMGSEISPEIAAGIEEDVQF